MDADSPSVPSGQWQRLPKRLCTAQRRHAALTCREEMALRRLSEEIRSAILLLELLEESVEDVILILAFIQSKLEQRRRIQWIPAAEAEFRHVRRHTRLWFPLSGASGQQVGDDFVHERLGFLCAAHLLRVMELLQVPEKFRLRNGSIVSGEHAFFTVLLRFRTTGSNSILEPYARMDRTQVSRTVSAFTEWLNAKILALPSWSIGWFATRCKYYNERFLRHFHDQDLECPTHARNTCFFIDGTVFGISRPTDCGAAEDMDIQNACYSGKDRCHGLKW